MLCFIHFARHVIDAAERDRPRRGQRGTLQRLSAQSLLSHHVAGIEATRFFLIGLLPEFVPRRCTRSPNGAGHVPASVASSVTSVAASAWDTGQFVFAASACFANVA
jgi:hypothetical protein